MLRPIAFVLLIAVSWSALELDGVAAKNWVLLAAGSSGWLNYRHQADVCHAYQIVHKNGIPDEQIVVMMFDDLANNENNPTVGVLINAPFGPDVYQGVPKDYTQYDVTPELFLDVLQGNPVHVGSQKVIQSGPDDNIFVFYADHGAPGLLGFPNGDVLHASDLIAAINNMHKNNKYKNLVIYVEACESGSMFDGLLPDNVNVFATTASNPTESSYACYYDDTRQTYLGDLYSVDWMEDSDKGLIGNETLLSQFQIVQQETIFSTVCDYGNLTIANTMLVADFQSENGSTIKSNERINAVSPKTDAVKVEDVPKSILIKQLQKETDPIKMKEILNELHNIDTMKSLIKNTFQQIATHALGDSKLAVHDMIESKSTLKNHECYMKSVDHFLSRCFDANNQYALRNLNVLVNLCEHGIASEQIMRSIDQACLPSKSILAANFVYV